MLNRGNAALTPYPVTKGSQATGAMARDPLGRSELAMTLAGNIDREAVQQLLGLLSDVDAFVRWQAGEAVAQTALRLQKRASTHTSLWHRAPSEYTLKELLAAMREGLSSPDSYHRVAITDALGLWSHEAIVPLLLSVLADSDPNVRASAVTGLGKLRNEAPVSALTQSLADPSLWVRRAAADALGTVAARQTVGVLRQALSDPQPLVRASAASALGHIRSLKSREALTAALTDGEAEVRWHAIRGLARTGTAGSAIAVEQLYDEQAVVCGETIGQSARSAVEQIRKRERGLWSLINKLFGFLMFHIRRLLARRSKAAHGQTTDTDTTE